MQAEAIRLYVGAGNETAYTHPPQTGAYACVAPVYGRVKKRETRVRLSADCRVFQDSGAFSDNTAQRLTFPAAMERQNRHAVKYGYADLIEAQASYDVLIDEVWEGVLRHKRRWSVADAEGAVDTTVAAAQWLHAHRDYTTTPRLILSAQGVDAAQYLDCARRVMPYMRDGDIFGLGGWCIIGKMPRVMMPTFEAAAALVIPFLGREGVKRVHIWGVCYAPALGRLLAACDDAGIDLSTDSAGPMLRPTLGQWGYDHWWRRIEKPKGQAAMSDMMTRHVAATRDWLNTLRQSKHYRLPVNRSLPVQLSLL